MSRKLAGRLSAVESRNVTYLAEDFPIFWDRAEGSHVWDVDGNRYVDLTAGFGVAAVGHAHPRIVEAIRAQAGRLCHGMGDVHPPAIKVELLERLAELSPYADGRAVLASPGGEAVEIALKTACLFTGKPGVLAFTGAYHGLTYGALAVTDRAHFRAPFESQLNPHVVRAGYPHPFRPPARLRARMADDGPEAVTRAALEDVEARLDGEGGERVGAVIVEPLQGRGGEVIPPPGFLAALARLCRDRGLLLIADEIFTGFGRAGTRFACETEGVVPDLLCLGKALSSSMPISACLGREEVMAAWPLSEGEAIHTSTFLGHPLGCAAALASLGVIEEEGLAARARKEGDSWLESLRSLASRHDCIGEVRGRGLMLGLDLVLDRPTRLPGTEIAIRVTKLALRRGWILLGGGDAGNVISLSPPLNIDNSLLDAAVEMLDDVLTEAAPD